jgi:hypothetical protein
MVWNEFWTYLAQGVVTGVVLILLWGFALEIKKSTDKKETDK